MGIIFMLGIELQTSFIIGRYVRNTLKSIFSIFRFLTNLHALSYGGYTNSRCHRQSVSLHLLFVLAFLFVCLFDDSHSG
jgi:hypothetical protein